MSAIQERKENIENWLDYDGWKWNKVNWVQEGTIYEVILDDNRHFLLTINNKVEKITISYKYSLSNELQELDDSMILSFLYELRINLMLMDVYFKSDLGMQNIELQQFIFWENCIRNKLLQSLYKMQQVIDLCEIKDKLFVKSNYSSSYSEY